MYILYIHTIYVYICSTEKLNSFKYAFYERYCIFRTIRHTEKPCIFSKTVCLIIRRALYMDQPQSAGVAKVTAVKMWKGNSSPISLVCVYKDANMTPFKRHTYGAKFKLKAICHSVEPGNRAAAREFNMKPQEGPPLNSLVFMSRAS